MPHIPDEELHRLLEDARQQVMIGGHYAHYRHPDQYYTILHVALLEDSQEPCIVYQAGFASQTIWVRPLADFLATVITNGKPTPRFSRIKPPR